MANNIQLIFFLTSIFILVLQILPTFSAITSCNFYEHTNEPDITVKVLFPILNTSYSFKTAEDGVQYTVGICKDDLFFKYLNLPPRTAAYQESLKPISDSNSPISSDNGRQHKALSLGSLDKTDARHGYDWLLLEYEGGDNYSSTSSQGCTGPRRTLIMIRCLEPWVAAGSDSGNASEYLFWKMEEDSTKTSDCYSLFELWHRAVCGPLKDLESQNPHNLILNRTRTESGLSGYPIILGSKGISWGTLLLLVASVLALLYVLGGMAYKFMAAGSRGWELVPHRRQWIEFGNLMADGCEAVFRSADSRSKYSGRAAMRDDDDELISGDASSSWSPAGQMPQMRQPEPLPGMGFAQGAGGSGGIPPNRDRSAYTALGGRTGRGAGQRAGAGESNEEHILPM